MNHNLTHDHKNCVWYTKIVIIMSGNSDASFLQVDYNMEQRKTLLSLAKVEMRRQELRQQAKEVCSVHVVMWSSESTCMLCITTF